MNCDACQSQTATVFYSHLAEGKLQKVNLCKSCAEEKGVTDPTGFSFAENLAGIGQESTTERPVQADELVCDHCGFTQTDFKKTGRFGCAVCYDVFDEGLDGLLDAMHKHTQHRGKRPSNLPELVTAPLVTSATDETGAEMELAGAESSLLPDGESDLQSQLDALRDSLSASIEAEDYEEAARLRDEISKLESREEEESGL